MDLLSEIWKRAGQRVCLDVYVYDSTDFLFIEAKYKGKDELTKSEIRFFDAALGCGVPLDRLLIAPQDEAAPAPRIFVMSNLVHNEQVKLAATFWNNLAVAALLGVFLVPAFYTRHTMLQQALSIGVGLAAAIALRMISHWWLTRLRD
jgi:hypothetical protein